ncbi:Dam family site-specific DNA-(adenine-N6)-methyltransferase [Ruminococcus flavefaciens]|uniref:Dam family site-specific DNA-(adenine-N6)-methyltransferase n=1 Tax=Ruminococcus flavefaciens TaxID=1265 RepID=UPI00056C6AF9|nr:DNA adenine methylase [Ruminococcus flavefaciens]
MIQSPLNYTGGKYKLLPQLLPLFPDKINTFVDLFCGGCNVGINVKANHHIYNDTNTYLLSLYNALKSNDKDVTLKTIYAIIEKYDLSLVSKNGYDFYGCNSSKGLSSYNKEKYLKMRDDYNLHKNENYLHCILLYVLIIYSFNNQIRFNRNGEFNLPVGKRDFNKKMEEKLLSFIDIIKTQDSLFTSIDFAKFDIDTLSSEDFVYIDPPYLITCATYNEQDGWNENDEVRLLEFIQSLTARNIRCALSNVLRSKGKENAILIDWLEAHKKTYTVHQLKFNYANSNYQTKDKSSSSEEVLITNY